LYIERLVPGVSAWTRCFTVESVFQYGSRFRFGLHASHVQGPSSVRILQSDAHIHIHIVLLFLSSTNNTLVNFLLAYFGAVATKVPSFLSDSLTILHFQHPARFSASQPQHRQRRSLASAHADNTYGTKAFRKACDSQWVVSSWRINTSVTSSIAFASSRRTWLNAQAPLGRQNYGSNIAQTKL